MPSQYSLYMLLGRGDGAADAARSPRTRLGFNRDLCGSWQYRRGFARGFLAIRKAGRHAEP